VVFYLEQFQGITQQIFNDWLGQLLIGIITAYLFASANQSILDDYS